MKRGIIVKRKESFTLIELLLVIGILGVISTAAVLIINPAELIKQGRDTTRLADLSAINKALSIYETEMLGGFMGTSSFVYVSIPDTTSTCANLGLPSLPQGYSYRCVTSSTLQKTDGTGWIPVNLSSLSTGSPLPKFPVDPINTTSSGEYYTYMTGGSWEVTAKLESSKYAVKARDDGGNDDTRYEAGTDLALGTAVNLVFNSEEQGIFFGVNTVYAQSGVNGQVSFFTDSTHITGDSNLFWDNSGKNLGIGTGSPGYKLDINGALRLRPSSAPTGANGVIYYDLGANAFKFYQNGAWVDLGSGGGTPAGSSGYVQFNNSGAFGGDGNLFWDNANKRLGIGTTAPGAKLEVKSSDFQVAKFGRINTPNSGAAVTVSNNAGYEWDFGVGGIADEFTIIERSYAGSPQRLVISKTSGNVGIGTTNPTQTLEVGGGGTLFINGTNNSYLRFADQAANGIQFANGQSYGYSIRADSSSNLQFLKGGVTTLYLNSSNNVGIGTTNPGEKLEVNGGVRLNTASAKPTCDSSKRGTLWFTQGAGGVKDALEVCAKDAGDAYAWRTIY